MSPRNPSELQRLFEEQQEHFVSNRNQEYRKMEQSLALTSDQAALVKEMTSIKDKIKNGYLSKSTKEGLLGQLRGIEHKLGIVGADYNSGEF